MVKYILLEKDENADLDYFTNFEVENVYSYLRKVDVERVLDKRKEFTVSCSLRSIYLCLLKLCDNKVDFVGRKLFKLLIVELPPYYFLNPFNYLKLKGILENLGRKFNFTDVLEKAFIELKKLFVIVGLSELLIVLLLLYCILRG